MKSERTKRQLIFVGFTTAWASGVIGRFYQKPTLADFPGSTLLTGPFKTVRGAKYSTIAASDGTFTSVASMERIALLFVQRGGQLP